MALFLCTIENLSSKFKHNQITKASSENSDTILPLCVTHNTIVFLFSVRCFENTTILWQNRLVLKKK